ncbi:hypothetical protein ACFVKB_35805 [Rhodococcus sp. NPDC127530]
MPRAALDELREAQRRGDFGAFGADLDRLQQAVDASLTSGG